MGVSENIGNCIKNVPGYKILCKVWRTPESTCTTQTEGVLQGWSLSPYLCNVV